MLCKYKDIFGKPKEGAHSYRIANLAIVDIILTIIVGYFIAQYFNLNLSLTIFTLFLIGIIAHRIFCVRTQVDKILFTTK
jgi:F0F1-type ATP synthase assembly protein I